MTRVPLNDLRHVEFNAVPDEEMGIFREHPERHHAPIKLWRDDTGVLRLTDGWHRLTLARERGWQSIAFEMHEVAA